MPTLILTVLLFIVFTFTGVLMWITLRLLKRKIPFKLMIKRTLIVYCICLPVFIFLAMPILFSELVSRASSRPQDRDLSMTPTNFGVDFKSVTFRSKDHLEIEGWYLPGPSSPAFILSHGLFRSRNEMLERGCRLQQLGYPVLLFDFRSHGTSEHGPVTLGIRERMDLMGAVDFMASELDHEEQVLYGVSMGAVASLLASLENPELVKAVIADSPYDELRNSIGKHVWMYLRLPMFPFSDVFLWNLERKGEFRASRFKPVDVVRTLDTPILFIYGSEDQRMDSSVAENLFRASTSIRKDLHFIEGAGHGAAFRTDSSTCLSLIHEFVQNLN